MLTAFDAYVIAKAAMTKHRYSVRDGVPALDALIDIAPVAKHCRYTPETAARNTRIGINRTGTTQIGNHF